MYIYKLYLYIETQSKDANISPVIELDFCKLCLSEKFYK